MSRALPRPRPGRPLLRRGRDRVQVGLDPSTAVVVERLSDHGSSVLLGIDGTVARSEIVAAAPELAFVLDALDRGLHLDDETGPRGAVSAHRRERFAADLAALALAHGGVEAERILARRGRSAVGVRGNDRAAALVAIGLAAAGVGTVSLEGPDRTVLPRDLTPSGPHEPDVSWRDEVSAVVRRAGAHPSPVSVRRRRPAAVVLCSAADVDLPWTDPQLGDDLLADGVPHLAVAVAGTSARVGPLVLPGSSACLWCLDQRSADLDPVWPALADQVRLRHAIGSTSLGVVASAAAALAVAHVLEVVDRGERARPASVDATIDLRAPDLLTERVSLVAHPACGCGWGDTHSTMVG